MSIFLEKEVGEFCKDSDSTKAGLARVLFHASKAWRSLYGDLSLKERVKTREEGDVVGINEWMDRFYPDG